MRIAAIVMSVLWASASWAQSGNQPDKPKAPSLAERLSEAEEKIAVLESWLTEVSTRMPYRVADLDCDSGRYVEALPESGSFVFLLACEQVEPYLEGYKVSIIVGNPHSVTFSDFSGSLGYGETAFKSFDQQVALTPVASLKAGSWTRITVTVNPATAKDLRFIRLEFKTQAVTFGR